MVVLGLTKLEIVSAAIVIDVAVEVCTLSATADFGCCLMARIHLADVVG